MQQHGQPQDDDQIDRVAVPGRHQLLHALERHLAAMTADHARQQPLLLAREPLHVGVLEQVGTVPVIAAVGDVEADLVQSRSPFQRHVRRRIPLELPGIPGLLQEIERRRLHSLGLREVDVIALLHAAHGAIARVLIRVAADHVIEQPLAHGAVGDPHLLEIQSREDLREDGEAAGKDRPAILGQRRELQLAHVTCLGQIADDALETRRGDQQSLVVELADGLADRPHGAGAAGGAVPAAAPEGRLHRLELQARGQARSGHALGGDLAVAEEPLAQTDAAHLQALEVERREALADDELRAAAADVHHEALAGLARHGVRHAAVDEPRLLHAGDDLDRVAQGLTGALEKGLLAMCEAQGIRPDDADAVGTHIAQPLPETLQAGKRPRGRLFVDPAVLRDARRQADHLTQAVDDDELAVRVARHDHVEAVGAEVYRGEDIGDGSRRGLRAGFLAVAEGGGGGHARCGAGQAEKEEPQPQVVEALGFRITNCAPSRPSR